MGYGLLAHLSWDALLTTYLHEVGKLDSLAHMLTVAAVGARTVASKFSVIPLIKLVNGAAHELHTKPNCNAFAAGKA